MDEANLYESITKNTPDNSGRGENLPESADPYDNIFPLDVSTVGTSLSDTQDIKKKSYRIATVCLGLLCALLLAGLIALAVLFKKHIISYNDVTEERNQLQTSYNNLTHENEQLWRNLEELISWRNDLPRRLRDHDGWVYFGGSLYFVSSLVGSWNDGRADCQKRGADLMIINSSAEQDFAKTFKKRLWIGLRDRKGTWTWVDGTPITTRYWAPSEPSGKKERCAEIKYFSLKNSVNDLSCNSRSSWICEKSFVL